MKNLKISRSLWLFAGCCFFISFVISIADGKNAYLPILNGITCSLMFINAYIIHKKIVNENKGNKV